MGNLLMDHPLILVYIADGRHSFPTRQHSPPYSNKNCSTSPHIQVECVRLSALYSPNLLCSDFFLFPQLKAFLAQKCFCTDLAMQGEAHLRHPNNGILSNKLRKNCVPKIKMFGPP